MERLTAATLIILAMSAVLWGRLLYAGHAGDSVPDGHRTALGWVMAAALAVSAGMAFNVFMREEPEAQGDRGDALWK